MKETGGRVSSSMIHLINCKNLCKSYNVPTPSTRIKKYLQKIKNHLLLKYILKFFTEEHKTDREVIHICR
jgi:hypothetical protein